MRRLIVDTQKNYNLNKGESAMQLIDVTNSYSRMIQRELIASPVHFIKVYTLGNSKVVYKKKHDFSEIVISNKIRPITQKEIDFVKTKLLADKAADSTVTAQGNLVEINLEN